MSKWGFILKSLDLIVDEKEKVNHYLIRKYEKTLDSIYIHLRYHNNILSSFSKKRRENVIKYMKMVEKTRMINLKYEVGSYGFEWYPLRLLEFDKWARENGQKKGRGKNGLDIIKKYAEYLYNKNTVRMINVNIKLLSGKVYNICFDASKGIFDLERTLVSIDNKVFCYNHMKFFKDGEEEDTPPYFKGKDWIQELSEGEVINIMINNEDEEKLSISSYISSDIILLRLYYKITSVFKEDRKIYGFEDNAISFFYNSTRKTFYSVIEFLGRDMEQVLRKFENTFFHKFTDRAFDNIISQWKVISQ
jgi:hypothetical protein